MILFIEYDAWKPKNRLFLQKIEFMASALKQRVKSTIALLLLPAVCWLFVNAAINQHSHILHSGYVITHAHPYTADKSHTSPFPSHKHSSAGYFFLSTVSNPATIFAAILAVLSLELFKTATIRFALIHKSLQKQFNHHHSTRGPPVYLCF